MATLVKAKFRRLNTKVTPYTPTGKAVEVQFNPTEFTLTKGAQIAEIAIPGLDMPILQFVRGQTETMALELFFDSTEADARTDADALSVTEKTDAFYQLIKIDRETHAIPVCRFEWADKMFPGGGLTDQWASQNDLRTNGFNCIVENVRQRFTMFSPKGVPLRATLSVQLKEYKSLDQQITQLNLQSPDHTHTHVVQRGDTLAGIANKTYGDPREWRAIASHNNLSNPMALVPGMVLEIPPIR